MRTLNFLKLLGTGYNILRGGEHGGVSFDISDIPKKGACVFVHLIYKVMEINCKLDNYSILFIRKVNYRNYIIVIILVEEGKKRFKLVYLTVI